MAKQKTGNGQPGPERSAPVIIKKYANRRLYNTATSGYVTLENLARMVREDTEFVVYDARTGQDITRSVLAQIILEEEGKGSNLLPVEFLRRLIRLYGDSLQAIVPGYLDLSMEAFARNQDQIRRYLSQALSGKSAMEQFEGLARQNVAFFERAMRMFSPFGSASEESGREDKPAERSVPSSPSQGKDPEIEELKRQISAMQRQLDDLAGRS